MVGIVLRRKYNQEAVDKLRMKAGSVNYFSNCGESVLYLFSAVNGLVLELL